LYKYFTSALVSGEFVPQNPYRGFAPGSHWGTCILGLAPFGKYMDPPVNHSIVIRGFAYGLCAC